MDDLYGERTHARFLSKIQKGKGGCWLWISTVNNHGYARLNVNRKQILMHRWAYTFYKGSIPLGMDIDHICRVPNCVNPDHLQPTTHRENILRGVSPAAIHARTTHCPEGHPYDEKNTSISKKRGTRNCLACKREKAHPYQQAIKEKITHCPQGHLYDAENTGIAKSGKRYCKACSRKFTPTYHRNNARKGA